MKFMNDMDTVIELVSSFTGLTPREIYKKQWYTNFYDAKSEFASCFNDDGRLEITVDNLEEPEYMEWTDIRDTITNLIVAEHIKEKYTEEDRVVIICLKHMIQILTKIIPRNSWVKNKLEKDLSVRKGKHINGIVLEENCIDYSLPILSYKAGMKVSKVISKIFNDTVLNNLKAPDEETKKRRLDAVNIIVSMFIQQLKANDIKVVLSINPLDFLLVSDHTTGWKSCHLWNDGCHKAGALSYMFDRCSMVSYAYRNKEPYEYGGIETYPLPIKLWRSMVHMDLDNRSAIHCRHYPNENKTFAKFARKLSAKVLSEYHETPYKWIYTAMKGGKPSNNEECEADVGQKKFTYLKTGLEYTDYVVDIVKLKDVGKPPVIHTGSDIICLSTGEWLNNSSELYYDESVRRCCECDENTTEDNACYIDDDWYCTECYNDLYSTCYECGEPHRNDDLTYMRNLDRDVCEDCIEEYYYQCTVCEDWTRHEMTYVDSVEGHVCNSCLDNNFIFCEDCGTYQDSGDVAYINGVDKYACNDCLDNYRYCEECEEYFEPENTTEQEEGLHICNDCLEEKGGNQDVEDI